MKEEIAEKWTTALCSGEYKQGKHRLRSKDEEFCCLGVLTDLYLKEKGLDWDDTPDNISYYSQAGMNAVITEDVRIWAGMRTAGGDRPNSRYPALFSLNDTGYTFQEIAKVIKDEKDTL